MRTASRRLWQQASPGKKHRTKPERLAPLWGTYRSAVLLAANLGGDADTTAAITGQLAGAIYGLSAIPQEWLEKLAWRVEIESLAEKIATLP